jgi:hypothetical protein
MNLVNGFASGNSLVGKIIDKPCQVKGFESSYHWHRLKVVRKKGICCNMLITNWKLEWPAMATQALA